MGRRGGARRPPRAIGAPHCDRRGRRGRGDCLAQRRADRDPARRQGIARSFTAAVARIAASSGAKVYAEVFPARLQRGAGLPSVERLAYFAELATVQLGRIKHLILVDAKAPASFFAYPGKPSYLVPDGCQVHELVADSSDVASSLEALVDRLGAAGVTPKLQQPLRPKPPTGELTAAKVCQAIGSVLPEGAIISTRPKPPA